jgi:hypothetical protein
MKETLFERPIIMKLERTSQQTADMRQTKDINMSTTTQHNQDKRTKSTHLKSLLPRLSQHPLRHPPPLDLDLDVQNPHLMQSRIRRKRARQRRQTKHKEAEQEGRRAIESQASPSTGKGRKASCDAGYAEHRHGRPDTSRRKDEGGRLRFGGKRDEKVDLEAVGWKVHGRV